MTDAPETRAATGASRSSTEPLLTVDEVSLSFGGVRALDDVSFTVLPGELFAIIGPNGAGKTSMFNCLNGVYRPQHGRIRLGDFDVTEAKSLAIAKQGVARTFQNLGLFMNLNVIDNLMLGRHLQMSSGFLAGALWWGKAKREELRNRRRVEEIIEMLELQPYRYHPVGLLPYGIQKRVELGRALGMDPKLLLLDEPVAGMNLEETEDMARYILEIKDELELAMILVEHDMHMVMDISDRVMALNFGLPIAVGTPAEVQSSPEVINAYLGESG
ncbi:MAG: ABC transporter ATP-binding protein [Acidimicrobiales bacterium]|nr:ABC transporter ATP-binding protein [Acidimicrobiales bacterium]